jgi:transcriptional regulator with XRE-family HTH domain
MAAAGRQPGCYNGVWEMNPLRQWRRNQKLRALDVAHRLEVSERTVLAWEHGAFKPSNEALDGLASMMSITAPSLRQEWARWLVEVRDEAFPFVGPVDAAGVQQSV